MLVDEAYFEFYGQSVMAARDEFPNLFVARTFSKAYGLAGLRIGVLVGDAEQMRSVRRVSSPYNVNAVALACLPEALSDQSYIQQYVSEVRESRARLERALEAAGIQFWPSQANFVLARVGAASGICRAHAATRNPGARPFRRSRVRRMRADHAGAARTCRSVARGSRRKRSRKLGIAQGVSRR